MVGLPQFYSMIYRFMKRVKGPQEIVYKKGLAVPVQGTQQMAVQLVEVIKSA